MDTFSNALLSCKTDKIPDAFDWFAPLLGDWDCDYYDHYENQDRHVKGEWIFRRVLDGAGIQDIFIFPSRATRESSPQPDAEYGSSLRMFNLSEGCYDVVYTCDHCMVRLRFTKDGERLVGQNLNTEGNYWVFSELTGNTFHWENLMLRPDGTKEFICEIFGKKISG